MNLLNSIKFPSLLYDNAFKPLKINIYQMHNSILPCGPVARMPGLHPGGPGSIPGMFYKFNLTLVTMHFFS